MKRFLVLFVSIFITLSFFAINIKADGEGDAPIVPPATNNSPSIVSTGSCGDNATYTIYSNKECVVSGTGKISFKGTGALTSNVTKIIVNEGITEIDDYGMNSGFLKEVNLPNSLIKIGERVFWGDNYLEKINIPNSVEYIGEYAFDLCPKLVYSQYDNCNYLGNDENPYVVLVECTDKNLTSISIHEDTRIIGNNAFTSSKISSITIPSKVKQLGTSCFSSCSNLTSITNNSSTKYVSEQAFYGTAISSITFNSGLLNIDKWAFYSCSNLQSIAIPNTLISIGENAIPIGNKKFKRIIFDGSLSEYRAIRFDDKLDYDKYISFAPYEVSGICGESITYALLNDGILLLSGSGEMFNKTLLDLPSYLNESITKVIIEDGITSIGSCAFHKLSQLTEVELPNSVTSIGEYAFYNDNQLVTINISSNITNIGKFAFYGCNLLNFSSDATKGPNALLFEGDQANAGSRALAVINDIVNYLNEVYLKEDPSLGFDDDYCSPADLKVLKNAADKITKDCTTDTQKANALYKWVIDNITYDDKNPSFSAIDVFRTNKALCSGFAHIMSAFFRAEGIPSAIVRCGLQVAPEISLEISNLYINKKPHEFSMAYIDGKWYGFDPTWKRSFMDEKEITNHYLVRHVDGVLVYTDEFDDHYDGTPNVYYKNGEFVCINKGVVNELSSIGIQVGGCLRYDISLFHTSFNTYYTALEGQINNRIGYTLQKGHYGNKLNNFMNIKEIKTNGVMQADYFTYNGTTYFSGTPVNNKILDIGLTSGNISMYIGETIDFSGLYDDYTISAYNSKLSTNGTMVTAVDKGYSKINITKQNESYSIGVYVYGNINESNDFFKSICDHEHYHEYDGNLFCDMCGEQISHITFKDGTNIIKTLTKKNNSIISESIDTYKNGYTFVGWYKEPTFDNIFILNTDKVESNLNLYGKWVLNPVINESKAASTTINGSEALVKFNQGNSKESIIDIEMSINNLLGGKVDNTYSGVIVTYKNSIGQVSTLKQGIDYLVQEGSVKIVFTKKYLDSLYQGTHTLEISLIDTSNNTYKYPVSIVIGKKQSNVTTNEPYKVVNTCTKNINN